MRPVSSRFLQSSSSFGRASPFPRKRERERMRERECSAPSRECLFLFTSSLALRPFHPFFLSLPFSPSLIERRPLLFPSALHSYPSFLFSFCLCLTPSSRTSSRCYRSRVSLLGLTHFPLPLRRAKEALPSVLLLVFRVVLFLFFHPSSYSPAGGSFSTRVRAGVSLPLTATTAVAAASTLLPRRRTASRCSRYFSLFPRPFLSLSIAVFCTLRI